MKKTVSMKLVSTVTGFSFLLLLACNNSQQSSETTTTHEDTMAHEATPAAGTESAEHATATLAGTKPDTAVNGTVHFDKDGDKVKMKLDIEVPKKANQSVAVHIHAMGDCGDMGKHAGGHWNPTNKNHGKWGSENFHSGDIGNINLDKSGKGTLELETDLWSLGGDSTKNILNKTIIVHSGVDDYKSQPAGNAGERIGCGVINASN